MRNQLLSIAMALGVTLAAGAQETTLQKRMPLQKQISPKAMNLNVDSRREIAKGLVEEEVVMSNGIRVKTVKNLKKFNNVINPLSNVAPKAETKEGFVLYEDFEDWNGADETWTPEGWTVDHRDSPASTRGWKMTQPLSMYDFISSKCMTYEMFEENVDEWLITPAFDVVSGMELCWGTMTSPYFYDWDYFNSTTFQLDEYVILNDIKVNVSTDGGKTWEEVFSHANNLLETAENFFAMFDYSVRPFTLSLEKYAGKTIKVGFQVTGHDGNTTFIDDVTVGMPLTQTKYTRPLSNLFFGLTDTDENVPASIMIGPVHQPVKYTNSTRTQRASFEWTYSDERGDQTATSRDLTLTYRPDYTDDFTTRNNLHTFPVLRGWSALTAPDEWTYPGYYQAGGRAEYERYYVDTNEREVIQLGMTVADPITEGSATYADIALPYFGYNQESDRFWGKFTFGDESLLDENNYNHLEKVGDLFYSPDSPMVIEGVHFNAFGKISRNAVFTAEIYLLDANYTIGTTPDYKAICTGDDITIYDRYSASDILCLNFKFDEPIVMSKSVAPYFMVAIGGFRDADNIEYFSPEMSNYGNPNNLGLGWTGHEIKVNGMQQLPISWSPVANYTDDLRVAFYIMLDGYFPWLESEAEEIALDENNRATVALDSYHHGDDLTVEGLPEWLNATVTGRYGSSQLVLSAEDVPYGDHDIEAKVKGHGVSKTIKVKAASSGISNIAADCEEGETAIYTLDGRRVASEGLRPGFYIKREGSKVTKIIVRD